MASFSKRLFDSVFTAGPNSALVLATNIAFAALQSVLLVLFITTYSYHFAILSLISSGLWFSINWFAHELQAEQAKLGTKQATNAQVEARDLEGDSDTETEAVAAMARKPFRRRVSPGSPPDAQKIASDEVLSPIDSSDSAGYVSTDSEWERVSEVDKKSE